MKKLFDVLVGNMSETALSRNNRRILSPEELWDHINSDCNPYTTGDNEGVIIYMSKKEYEEFTQ